MKKDAMRSIPSAGRNWFRKEMIWPLIKQLGLRGVEMSISIAPDRRASASGKEACEASRMRIRRDASERTPTAANFAGGPLTELETTAARMARANVKRVNNHLESDRIEWRAASHSPGLRSRMGVRAARSE